MVLDWIGFEEEQVETQCSLCEIYGEQIDMRIFSFNYFSFSYRSLNSRAMLSWPWDVQYVKPLHTMPYVHRQLQLGLDSALNQTKK